MTTTRRTLLAASGALLAAPAIAKQGFPSRPIRFICPFPAGGIVDLVIRAVADDLAADLGRPVVVDVRTGAGGLIGSQLLVAAPPDGHTWMMASLSHSLRPILNRQAGFHPVDQVQGLALVSHSLSVLVVQSASPIRSLQDFAAAARARPGALNYLQSGIGSFTHISMEMMQRAMNTSVTAVDSRGLPPGIVDLLAGRLDVAMLSTGPAMPHIREGRMRPIATVGVMRSPDLPDVPTLAELGVPEANLDAAYVAIAPRGLPAPVLARIEQAFARVLARPEAQQRLRGIGTLPAAPTPATEVQALLASECAKFVELVRVANIPVQ